MTRSCPACGYAFGGRVGDYAQRKAEAELDEQIDDDDDDEDERAAKHAAVHAGVDVAREAIGAASGFAHGGRVSSLAEHLLLRRKMTTNLARLRRQ